MPIVRSKTRHSSAGEVVASLGNKSFQGHGLHPEVARRLDDLVKGISSNSTQIDALQKSAVTPAQVQETAAAAANSAVSSALLASGPGPGTYTIGAKLTPGGKNGTITIDSQGRITQIQQAS
jgi:hypothetical protein